MNDKQIEERNELFDSAVREQLTDYEPKVPHALWNRICSELDKGEASEESVAIPLHHEKSSTGKWKLAIAAAVVLTLTVGTLLYTQNPMNGANVTSSPVANKTSPAAVNTNATVSTPVTETKMVAQAKVEKKKAVMTSPAQKKEVDAKVTMKAVETALENNTAKTDPTTAQEMPIEFAPILSENKPVDVGSIPLASLNFLSTPSSLNDEITVIKSTEKKKKHSKKGDDESTKVILLGKKYESKPDIIYQIPVRF